MTSYIHNLMKISLFLILTFSLQGCSSMFNIWGSNSVQKEEGYSPRVVSHGKAVPKGGGRYKLGLPYTVGGITYRPREQPYFDKVGMASWYGKDFHGRLTANGEVYDMGALTAAHPTLPLPSLVEVQNLENGRKIVVRVNDRGPYAKDRLIDMSAKAADLLGFKNKGVQRVRVRYVGKAPLDGNDRYERHFLAQQNWSGDGSNMTGATGSSSRRYSWYNPLRYF